MKIYFKMRKLSEGGKIVIKGRETIEIIFDQGSNFKEIEIEFDEMSEHPANDHKAEEEQLEQTANDHKSEEDQLKQTADDHKAEEEQLEQTADDHKAEEEQLKQSVDDYEAEEDQLEHPANDHKAEEEQLEQTADDHKAEEEQLEQPVDDHEIEEPIQPEEALEKFATESTNFEEFLDQISIYLNIGRRKEFFKEVVLSASKTKKLTWRNINIDKKFTESDKLYVNNLISKCFGIGIMTFIKLLLPYKENFRPTEEEKVQRVLNELNLDTDVKYIPQIIKIALISEFNSLEEVFSKTKIPEEEWNEVRMEISHLINEHTNSKIKVIDFLKSLKKM